MGKFSKYIGSEYVVCKETFNLPIQQGKNYYTFYKDKKYRCQIDLKYSLTSEMYTRDAVVIWVKENTIDSCGYFYMRANDEYYSDYILTYFYSESEYKIKHRKSIIEELL